MKFRLVSSGQRLFSMVQGRSHFKSETLFGVGQADSVAYINSCCTKLNARLEARGNVRAEINTRDDLDSNVNMTILLWRRSNNSDGTSSRHRRASVDEYNVAWSAARLIGI